MSKEKLHKFNLNDFQKHQNSNDIVTVANSILQHFDIAPYHNTNKYLDTYLQKGYQKVVVLLVDGMGCYNIENSFNKQDYLYKNMKHQLMTVFPSTTTAATTAICNGRYPIETSWMAWQQYFMEFQKEVILFLNKGYYDNQIVDEPIETILPYESLWEILKREGIDSDIVFPSFKTEGMHTFSDVCQRIAELSSRMDKGYIYGYWDEYDGLMHKYGTKDKRSMDCIAMINTLIEELRKQLDKDTLLIVLADHGHIDTKDIAIHNYPKLINCLERNISFETRAVNFFVKKGKEKEFEEQFLLNFNNSFILLNKEQVLENHILGIGKIHPRALDFLGDYLALAIDDICIVGKPMRMKGQHAGFTVEEMMVPLIVLE